MRALNDLASLGTDDHAIRLHRQQAVLRPAGVKAVVISLDAAWTYLGCRKGEQRQSVWIWTVVESSGRWWRDFEVGGRDTETFLRLLARLPEAAKYSADRCVVYNWLLPDRHVARQGREANRNEGLPSVLRGKLNRLARPTEGYTKKVEMTSGSLALLWLQQSWIKARQHVLRIPKSWGCLENLRGELWGIGDD